MRLNRKLLLAICTCGLMAVTVGCSGINASKSISPATFLIPGFMKAEPPPEKPVTPPAQSEPARTFARL